MKTKSPNCVLLADRHYGLAEGVRVLLGSLFDVVVTVADETSLQESATRLRPQVAVVELSLNPGGRLEWLSRLRASCPDLKVIVLSVHDEPSVRRSALAAGADGFVVKRSIATDLLPVVESVLTASREPE